VRLRRLHAGDAERLRELRLRALLEAPDAFAATYADERLLPQEVWGKRATTGVTVVAVDGDRWVGMVVGSLVADSPGSAWLAGLWVEPDARRAGLGSRLVDAVADWAREQGAATLELSVTTNNRAAEAFYARAGFVETGRRRPLPADPSRTEVFLSRPL
jgi:ribosomal protein S18 acetylase RimI-like enzyme